MTIANPFDTDPAVRVIELATSDDSGLIATAFRRPTLRWRLETERVGVIQAGYELELAADPSFSRIVAASGWIASALPFGAAWPGPDLDSREVVWCRVRVWTDRGATAWSAPLRIEGALFHDADWLARPISPECNRGRTEPVPVPLMRRAFALDTPVIAARLYATALGVCCLWLNGREVSADRLDPGWTAYRERLLYSSYDVLHLLRPGENVIAAEVGDGWWRGKLTWTARRGVYGDTTALLAQLEVTFADGSSRVIATDGSWRASTGSLREADIYDGCRIDLGREQRGWREPGFDDAEWCGVAMLALPQGLEQRSMPGAREVLTVRPTLGSRDGLVTVDAGQNLTGHLRLTVESVCEATVTVRHAEVLQADGSLFTAALRSARATDSYHIPAGRSVLEPSYTYHGFRHAEIALSGGAALKDVEVSVLSSDLAEIGSFACSEPLLNQLYSNIKWSQRGNFISLPTDCPQRDERLGWTGDIQVFASTACANFDSRAFLASWLTDLAIEQRADGQVPSTVPNVIDGHPFEFGGVGWADAATLVPCALYEAYGDRDILARQFSSMRAWVDWGASRLDSDGVWKGDFHLGDWLDPNAPPDKPELATTDRHFIASSYLSFSAGKVAAAARVLGLPDEAERYAALSARVAAATWAEWHDAVDRTQSGCAIAIAFGIVPGEMVERIGFRLAELVDLADGRIGTGFLGTPVILPALTMAGQHGAAWRLLMNRETPGWLFQVLRGATTMWERWDAITADGEIASGAMDAPDAESMTSFNHYAYGSVGAWLYRTLAGIAPGQPGYALIDFAPQPPHDLPWARASIETPFGRAAISWQQSEGLLDIDLTIPPGARGTLQCPVGWEFSPSCIAMDFGSGEHRQQLKRTGASR